MGLNVPITEYPAFDYTASFYSKHLKKEDPIVGGSGTSARAKYCDLRPLRKGYAAFSDKNPLTTAGFVGVMEGNISYFNQVWGGWTENAGETDDNSRLWKPKPNVRP